MFGPYKAYSLVVEAQNLGFVGKIFYQADTFPKDSLYHSCSSEKMPHLSHVGKPRFQAPFIMAPCHRPKIQQFQTKGRRGRCVNRCEFSNQSFSYVFLDTEFDFAL